MVPVGKLEVARQRARWLLIHLGAVDATIRLPDPDIDPDTARPNSLALRNAAGRAEICRAALDMLREAAMALPGAKIASLVLQRRSLRMSHTRLTPIVQTPARPACGICRGVALRG